MKGGLSSNSLSDQLRAKAEADRLLTETIYKDELNRLASNLNNESQTALYSMKLAIEPRLSALTRSLQQSEARAKQWPLWIGASCLVMSLCVLLGLWIMTSWMRSDLNDLITAKTSEQKSLDLLQAQTGGIRIVKQDTGTFLFLPESAEMDWKCNKKPCIKLSK